LSYVNEIFTEGSSNDLLPYIKQWTFSDIHEKSCAGFSKKVKKKNSFFMSHFRPLGKCANIFGQNYVKLSCRCYDTTLVALGNGVQKGRGFPFFDLEPY